MTLARCFGSAAASGGTSLAIGDRGAVQARVERILELIELPSQEEVLTGAPEAVRAALAAGDMEALGVARGEMPAAEAEALVERLKAVGVLG